MAEEFKIDVRLQLENGNFRDNYSPSRFKPDQASIGMDSRIHSIGTSEEAITFTDISTEGILVMQNLDASNFVQWGPEDTGAMVEMGRMNAGDPPVIIRMDSSATLRLKADTAACDVLIKLYEA